RDVDLLDHRGQDDVPDVGRRGQRLVRVDTDRPVVGTGGLGRGEDTTTGATGSVVHDVRALLEHALGRGLALGRVTEAAEVRRLGEVLGVDLDVGVDRLGAGHEARLELLDQVHVDATDEADVA